MGNASGIQENEKERLNSEEIIENDCYEEIDLKKINKIIEEEKNWNKNSIIYSVNQLELQQLNEEVNALNQKDNQNLVQNKEPLNNIIEEQKNEEDSEDKKKENTNKEDNIKKENNINMNGNIKENANIKEENKKKGIEEIKEENEEEKVFDANGANEKKNESTQNNTNDQQQNKTENNKTNMKENHQINGKISKYSIKVKNIKPKIRPKNTSDEALRGPNSPKNMKRGAKRNMNKQDKGKEKEKDKDKGKENKVENKKVEEKKVEVPETIPSPAENRDLVEEFDIKNIIPEYRLNHLKDDEIIYSGTLEKILKIPEKNSIVYSQRFCVFTKKYFAYYKSKESYISLNKPMLLINNNYIIRIENTTLDGGSFYFGIICEVNDETRGLINKVNSFVTEEANSCELLLGFRTKEYENMMKWVVVLRHFINHDDAF